MLILHHVAHSCRGPRLSATRELEGPRNDAIRSDDRATRELEGPRNDATRSDDRATREFVGLHYFDDTIGW